MASGTYLDAILRAHRARAARDRRDVAVLLQQAQQSPPVRDLAAALVEPPAGAGNLAIIAEIKRRSPSRGDLATELDAAEVARQYQAGGAACLSVLTDVDFFGGSTADLAVARHASQLPVLRKDFTVSAADVCDTRLMGADAVLLIVAALDDQQLAEMVSLADQLQLSALVEVHDEAEAERAVVGGARIIGVNQRDLVTFAVDPQRAERVAAVLPRDVVAVAESGITGPDDIRRLADAGYQAALVGEALVRSERREESLAALTCWQIGARQPTLAGR